MIEYIERVLRGIVEFGLVAVMAGMVGYCSYLLAKVLRDWSK